MCVRTLDLLFTGLSHLVAERIPDQESAEKWVKGKLNKAFLHFLPNLRIFEKSSNMPKIWQKMKKSLVQLAFKPHFSTVYFQNPGFGYAICHYHSAPKLGKKCNFKSAKKHYLPFQKWPKINFCTRKKFKTTKNPGFFSVL